MASPAPVNVAPLIKFSRWALLSAGVVYGFGKNAALSVVEGKRREKRDMILREQEPILRKKREMEYQEELRKLKQAIFPEAISPGQAEKCDCK